MSRLSSYTQAISDFREARRKAALQNIMARITGKSIELLSYEDVRKNLRALESGKTELRDIPLDAIIGSVGRYTDFTRNFLPKHDSDQQRWANVMSKATDLIGLPPIEVYQLGAAYFVLDGNHRVSVARQLGATSIQAYVTEVRSRVSISPDIQPDDLIIKAEQTQFLEQTQLDHQRPDADLTVTNPGQYPILLEHIAMHQFFMGIDEQRDITYAEAVSHWYDVVYKPVVQIIRERGILRNFPNRTETDLYLWISRHQAELEEALGWHIATQAAAADLKMRFSPELSTAITRLTSRIVDIVTPDPLEPGPPPGSWRETTIDQRREDRLFANILVTVRTEEDWAALDQAIRIAHREVGHIQGLHIVKYKRDIGSSKSQALSAKFEQRCRLANLHGHFAIETGSIARVICDRSRWTDLIVSKLNFPPGDHPLARFSSGFRTMLRRCPRPILIVPSAPTDLNHALLAYNGTPKADEALYLSAYLAAKWKIRLSVLVIEHHETDAEILLDQARNYLESHQIEAAYRLHGTGHRSDIILEIAQNENCDFILMGGYKASPMVEIVLGSVVDEVLRKSHLPLLICR